MSGPIAPPWAIIPGLIGQRCCTDSLAQDAPIEGLERDILVGLNGVFLQADRPVGRLTVPHTPAVGPLHGLWPVAPGVRLRHGPLPLALLAEALELFAFAARWVPPLELVAPIVLDGDRYALHLPEQDPATHRVEYLAPALWPVGLTLHNHTHDTRLLLADRRPLRGRARPLRRCRPPRPALPGVAAARGNRGAFPAASGARPLRGRGGGRGAALHRVDRMRARCGRCGDGIVRRMDPTMG